MYRPKLMQYFYLVALLGLTLTFFRITSVLALLPLGSRFAKIGFAPVSGPVSLADKAKRDDFDH